VTTDLLLTLAAAAEAREARDVKTREASVVDAAVVLVFLWPVAAVEPAVTASTSVIMSLARSMPLFPSVPAPHSP
jgi:hypothetical protein